MWFWLFSLIWVHLGNRPSSSAEFCGYLELWVRLKGYR